jgi:hypothetical protein
MGARLRLIDPECGLPAQLMDLRRLPLSSDAAEAYCQGVAPDPGSHSSDKSRAWEGPEFLRVLALTRAMIRAGAQ